MARCQGRNAEGKPCGAPERVVNDRGWCTAHDPEAKGRMSEIGRKGAEATAKKLRAPGLDPDTLPKLDDHESARRWLEAVAAGVLAGKITHQQAKAATGALREWVRALEGEAVAVDMDRLEAEVEELRSQLDGGRLRSVR